MSNKRKQVSRCSSSCKRTRKFINNLLKQNDYELWTTGKSHYLLVCCDAQARVFFPFSPSDGHRSFRNLKAELKRQGVIYA